MNEYVCVYVSTLSIFYGYFKFISLRTALQSDMWVENDTLTF